MPLWTRLAPGAPTGAGVASWRPPHTGARDDHHRARRRCPRQRRRWDPRRHTHAAGRAPGHRDPRPPHRQPARGGSRPVRRGGGRRHRPSEGRVPRVVGAVVQSEDPAPPGRARSTAGSRRGAGRGDLRGDRQATRRGGVDRADGRVRDLAVVRAQRCSRAAPGAGRCGHHGPQDRLEALRADGGRGCHQPVELPVHLVDDPDPHRAVRRQHGGGEALRGHPDRRVGDRRAVRPRRVGRHRAGGHRRRRHRRGDRARRRRQGGLHRVGAHRQAGDGARRPTRSPRCCWSSAARTR